VREYLKYYSAPQTFSNALSPIQAAIALKSFEIVASAEGQALRAGLISNISYLRHKLQEAGFEIIGDPSAIVPLMMREEGLARLVASRLPDLGVLANLVEYPAVARGSARFRFQVMASHTRPNIDDVVARLRVAYGEAEEAYRHYRRLAVARGEVMTAAVGR
jgi:glycine C-acetyltransferase